MVLEFAFVQCNRSKSSRGVLCDPHYQIELAQGKLARCTHGSVFDVAVNLRKPSPHFGPWVGGDLSAENKRQTRIPPGIAHGFLLTSKSVELLSKATYYWDQEHRHCPLWNDRLVSIQWQIGF